VGRLRQQSHTTTRRSAYLPEIRWRGAQRQRPLDARHFTQHMKLHETG
jgi:hypothetical protein